MVEGKLFVCGSNSDGELGLGDNNYKSSFTCSLYDYRLHQEVKEKNENEVQKILEEGREELTLKDKDGKYSIEYAIENKNDKMTRMIVESMIKDGQIFDFMEGANEIPKDIFQNMTNNEKTKTRMKEEIQEKTCTCFSKARGQSKDAKVSSLNIEFSLMNIKIKNLLEYKEEDYPLESYEELSRKQEYLSKELFKKSRDVFVHQSIKKLNILLSEMEEFDVEIYAIKKKMIRLKQEKGSETEIEEEKRRMKEIQDQLQKLKRKFNILLDRIHESMKKNKEMRSCKEELEQLNEAFKELFPHEK